MTKDKLAELQAQGERALAAAKAIAEAAEAAGRKMSDSEQASYEGEMAAATSKLAEIRTAKDDLAVIEKAREIGEAMDLLASRVSRIRYDRYATRSSGRLRSTRRQRLERFV